MEAVLIKGDLSKLSEEQRVVYYNKVCESVGLNKYTRPFEYLTLNGKLTLYARKDCTDQLRQLHKISLKITDTKMIGDIYVVTVVATRPDGREDSATGAVSVGNAKGDVLANLFMKAETKAKRRVTLSICGLGMLDETEVESIPEVKERPKYNSPRLEAAVTKVVTAQHEAAEWVQKGFETKEKWLGMIGLVYSAGKKAGWNDEQIKGFMKSAYDVDSSKKLDWGQLNELKKHFENNPRSDFEETSPGEFEIASKVDKEMGLESGEVPG